MGMPESTQYVSCGLATSAGVRNSEMQISITL